MNAVTTTQPAPYGTTGLVPHNMDEALRLAEFMSRARTVPKHLQDSPGDCLMAIEQAMRWGMSPFAVAQATSVISGKLMFEGKLVAAAVESSGAIVGQFDYEYSGEGDARSITVSATRRGETQPRTVTVAFKDARTNNEMWKRQPDQQLTYHGVRVWARRWTPAVILGVYSREEMGPIIEGEAVETASPDRQAINDAVPLKPAAAATPRAERKVDPTVYETPKRTAKPLPRTPAEWNDWMDNDFIPECTSFDPTTDTRADLEAMTKGERFKAHYAAAPPPVRRDIDRQLAATHGVLPEKLPDPPDPPEEEEAPEVIGGDKVMAGD